MRHSLLQSLNKKQMWIVYFFVNDGQYTSDRGACYIFCLLDEFFLQEFMTSLQLCFLLSAVQSVSNL